LAVASVIAWICLSRRRPKDHSYTADQYLVVLADRLSGEEVLPSEPSIERYIQPRVRLVDGETAVCFLRVLATIGSLESSYLAEQMSVEKDTATGLPIYGEAVRSAAAACAERIRRRLAEIEEAETLLRPSGSPHEKELLRPLNTAGDTTPELLLRAEASENDG
jgi:hypothetical protein